MISLQDARNKIEQYQEKYRNANLPNFEISDVYDLFPDEKSKSNRPKWSDTWPNADRQGVSLMLDDNLLLLYIGKVSLSNTFGGRFTGYFCYDDNKKCKPIHSNWSQMPKYVVPVAVPRGMAFEAPALEEYLITEFKGRLPDNKLGN